MEKEEYLEILHQKILESSEELLVLTKKMSVSDNLLETNILANLSHKLARKVFNLNKELGGIFKL